MTIRVGQVPKEDLPMDLSYPLYPFDATTLYSALAGLCLIGVETSTGTGWDEDVDGIVFHFKAKGGKVISLRLFPYLYENKEAPEICAGIGFHIAGDMIKIKKKYQEYVSDD